MSSARRFFDHAEAKLREVLETQLPNIEKAAQVIAQCCREGGKFYVFGSGHSHMITEELYLRAGGLALVHGILPPEVMLHQMSQKSSVMERIEGYGSALVELYKVDAKDAVLVVSNSGRNPAPVDVALRAREKGAKVIALTSMRHSAGCTSRHSSGKKLYEIADVTIDNCAVKGDADFPIPGLDVPMGPVSSVTGIVIAEALACQVAENLAKMGMEPPVFVSSNVDGGDARNEHLYETYYGYWK